MSLLPTWERYKREPETFEVDAALEAMEWAEEKERTRKRIADLNAQRKPIVVPRWAVLLAGLACLGAFWGFAIAWVYPLLHRWLVRAGLL